MFFFFFSFARCEREEVVAAVVVVVGQRELSSLFLSTISLSTYHRICALKPKYCCWLLSLNGKEKKKNGGEGENEVDSEGEKKKHFSLSLPLPLQTHLPLRQQLRELKVLREFRLGADTGLDVLLGDVGPVITD